MEPLLEPKKVLKVKNKIFILNFEAIENVELLTAVCAKVIVF